MNFTKKARRVCLISIASLLLIGTVVVCIFGEKQFNEQKYKKYTGAKEVNSTYLDTYEN